ARVARSRCSALALLLLSWLVPAQVQAHDPGLSAASVTVTASRVAFRLLVNDADLRPTRRAAPGCDARDVLIVHSGEATRPVTVRCVRHDATHTAFVGELEGVDGALSVELTLLSELPRGHRCFVRVLDDRGMAISEQLVQH